MAAALLYPLSCLLLRICLHHHQLSIFIDVVTFDPVTASHGSEGASPRDRIIDSVVPDEAQGRHQRTSPPPHAPLDDGGSPLPSPAHSPVAPSADAAAANTAGNQGNTAALAALPLAVAAATPTRARIMGVDALPRLPSTGELCRPNDLDPILTQRPRFCF